MHVDRGPDAEAFARKHYIGIDRVREVFLRSRSDSMLDVAAQGVADVDLLSCYGRLQGSNTLSFDV